MKAYISDKLVAVLGEPEFYSTFMESLQFLFGVDYCTLFDYSKHQSNPKTLFSGGDFVSEGDSADIDVLYRSKFFKIDPLYMLARLKNDSLSSAVYRTCRNDVVNAHYRKEVYDRTQFLEKASILIPSMKSIYCLNLYRHKNRGIYEPSTFKNIQDVSSLLSSLVIKHEDLKGQQSRKFDLSAIFQCLNHICHHVLTPRELEVCARIVRGYSSEGISLDLGISINTVHTHRRQAYKKLGIGTQNQLFGFLYENRFSVMS